MYREHRFWWVRITQDYWKGLIEMIEVQEHKESVSVLLSLVMVTWKILKHEARYRPKDHSTIMIVPSPLVLNVLWEKSFGSNKPNFDFAW